MYAFKLIEGIANKRDKKTIDFMKKVLCGKEEIPVDSMEIAELHKNCRRIAMEKFERATMEKNEAQIIECREKLEKAVNVRIHSFICSPII